MGAGVLGLPSAMAYLGWPGGIIVLILSCKNVRPCTHTGFPMIHRMTAPWWGMRMLDQLTRSAPIRSFEGHDVPAGIISLYTLWQLCVLHEHDGKRFNRYHELAQVLMFCS